MSEITADPTKPNHSPIVATQKQTQISPIESQTNDKSPTTLTDTNLLITLGPIEAKSTQIWAVNSKEFYQGRIARGGHGNEAPYLYLGLMNTFIDDNYYF